MPVLIYYLCNNAFQISHFKFQISNFKSRISNLKFEIMPAFLRASVALVARKVGWISERKKASLRSPFHVADRYALAGRGLDDFSTGARARSDTLRARMPCKYLSRFL
ncbi:MAG TPA: hypothetical protein VF703_07855 [Pyrinomonadaceae bacterium]